MTPRVSVLVPVWRPDLRFLREAIESVRAQTLADWELLLVEDPPASDAAALVASFADPRIRHVVRESRSALPDALNEGLRLCRAPYVARLDGDDVCMPERLAIQAAHLDANPRTAVVGSRTTIIDGDGNVIGVRKDPTGADDVAAAMRRYNCIAHPSVMFRRDVVLDAGGYAKTSPEDYDLWCRLMVAGHRLENRPEELLRYRFHEGASKFEAVHDVVRVTIAVKKKYFAGRFTLRDRLRILGEQLLLLVPPRVILWLFRAVTYR